MPGGWIQGKPVTALMRQLMDEARHEDFLVAEDTAEFYASRVLERWRWLRVRRQQDRSLRIGLTDLGREVLSAGD